MTLAATTIIACIAGSTLSQATAVGITFRSIAVSDVQAPGFSSGVNYSTVGSAISINNTGGIAYTSTISGSGVSSSNNQVLYSSGAGSSLAPVAREGTQAPGLPAGIVYSQFGRASLNDSGELAFWARVV